MVASQIAFDFGLCPTQSPAPRPELFAAKQAARTRASAPVAAKPSERALRSVDDPAKLGIGELEAALQPASPTPVRVTLTDNRRTMISLTRRPHRMHVRLHHMFAEADAATLTALGAYLANADRDAARVIGRFIERHRTHIRRRTEPAAAPLVTDGQHHDLARIYADVNARYFDNQCDVQIGWSRDSRVKTRSARSIKLGSYLARDRLVRVHPALDAAYVPRYFIEYIVYHELLHHVVPARRAGRRRCLHGPEFRARERAFARFDDALRWERDNLGRLLRR